jgi:hypothetical protein
LEIKKKKISKEKKFSKEEGKTGPVRVIPEVVDGISHDIPRINGFLQAAGDTVQTDRLTTSRSLQGNRIQPPHFLTNDSSSLPGRRYHREKRNAKRWKRKTFRYR